MYHLSELPSLEEAPEGGRRQRGDREAERVFVAPMRSAPALLLLALLQLSFGSSGSTQEGNTADPGQADGLPPSYSGPGGGHRKGGGRGRRKPASQKSPSRFPHRAGGSAQLPLNGLELVRQWWGKATAYPARPIMHIAPRPSAVVSLRR